ncbi:hypothetical protein niasHT_004114 [Heterodera trifolii]|uniref:BTB domain-containing protein n=1 Tax=Heterodera trifolii TaxID=157864 RepID=A0ABD2LSK5_9BILA
MELPKSLKMQSDKDTDQQTAEDANNYKRSGQILFRVTDLSNAIEATDNEYSDPELINGLEWRIYVTYGKNGIGVYLACGTEEDLHDMAWCCQASWQLSVVAESDEYDVQKWTVNDFNVFNALHNEWGRKEFATFEDLMDPQNGLYNGQEDTVTLKAIVITEKPRGMTGIRTEDALMVNGQIVYVNKYLLATHSDFFRTLFFGQSADENPKIVIEGEDENAVANFERTISLLSSPNEELDDFCVESVLLLANRFLFDSIENRCVSFLMNKSKKPKIFKFRLAHQCAIIGMKNAILNSMKKEDFDVNGYSHYDILSEHNKLDEEAAKELRERHKSLFGTKKRIFF